MQVTIIKKTKITWVLAETSVAAFDNIQATLYHAYNAPNRKPIKQLRDTIDKSADDEYNSWADVISLALSLGVVGYGTKIKPQWVEARNSILAETGRKCIERTEPHVLL